MSKVDPNLQEGIHFSVMFYGGRLAAHLSGNDIDEAVEGFISLRRLNRRAVIVIDSDYVKSTDSLNPTKTRLVEEFKQGPGYPWVTQGREIENYVHPDQLRAAIEKVAPSVTVTRRFGRYDKALAVRSSGNKARQAPKVEVAKYVTGKYELFDDILDLRDRIVQLVKFIYESNPAAERASA